MNPIMVGNQDHYLCWPLFTLYVHKWYLAMKTPGKVIRNISLDLRKAYDLFDHNRPLGNCEKIGVRSAPNSWLGSYLKSRTQVTNFGKEFSQEVRVKGGVPLGTVVKSDVSHLLFT